MLLLDPLSFPPFAFITPFPIWDFAFEHLNLNLNLQSFNHPFHSFSTPYIIQTDGQSTACGPSWRPVARNQATALRRQQRRIHASYQLYFDTQGARVYAGSSCRRSSATLASSVDRSRRADGRSGHLRWATSILSFATFFIKKSKFTSCRVSCAIGPASSVLVGCEVVGGEPGQLGGLQSYH